MPMTDPMDALVSLQGAVRRRLVDLQSCEIYPELRVVSDQPDGSPRITYANVENGKVLAVSIFALVEPVNGVPCFQIGYAVIEPMRQQGLGSDIVAKGIEELRNGLKRHGPAKFYVEAVVGVSNEFSNRLARRLLSHMPKECTDGFSGEPSFQYLKLVE